MDKIYINRGSYNIIYQIPKIIYSSLISSVLNTIIKLLGLSESDVLKLKKEKENKKNKNSNIALKKIKRGLKIKFLLFFIIYFLFQIIFWYYVTCFCGIYKNTQIILFKDSFLSFFISLFTPFLIFLLPVVFRVYSLKNKNKYCFNFSSILQTLIDFI